MVNEQNKNSRTHEQNNSPVARAFPALDQVSVGVFAWEQSSGRVIVDHNSTRPLPPASNTKLITTALALDRLGPNYRFEVSVRGDRNQITSTGRADPIVLWSDRSPVVDVDNFSEIAASMRDSGVSSVGDLVLDVSDHALEEYAPGWMWNDEQHYYGAKITPIAVSGNTVEVTISVDGATEDDRISVVSEPDSPIVELSFALEVVDEPRKSQGATENAIEAFKRHGSNQLRIAGRISPNETHHATLPVGEPLEHAGNVFAQALDRTGIEVDGEIRVMTEPNPKSEPLSNEHAHNEWSIESPPISEIVRMMNHPSDNFIAEQLALAVVCQEQNRQAEAGSGSWEKWETLVGKFLEARGINESEYRLRDGSGLSRYNRISAHGLATLVDWAVDQPWGGTFLDSLPVAGRDGTLSDRLGDLDDETTIRAKTGSLTGTRTLTGVIEREEGATITFSVMVSNLTGAHESRGKEYLDTFVRELIAIVDTE